MNITVHYHNWSLNVNDTVVTVVNSIGFADRCYDLPEIPVRFEHEDEYVCLYFEDDTHYQYKFEGEDFFVGDHISIYGENIDSVACWVFGEDDYLEKSE